MIDFFNISITSKMFYLVCRAYEEFVWKMRLPKHIFGESDYQEFLLTELLQLGIEISDEFFPLIKKTALCFHLSMRSWRSFFRAFLIQNSLSCILLLAWKQNCRKMSTLYKIFGRSQRPEKRAWWCFFYLLFWSKAIQFWHPLPGGTSKGEKDHS